MRLHRHMALVRGRVGIINLHRSGGESPVKVTDVFVGRVFRQVPVENVRIISPYIGGGFGGKLFLRSDALLAALAARAVKRPVKVMLPLSSFITAIVCLHQRGRRSRLFEGLGHYQRNGLMIVCRPERENHRYLT